MYSFVMAYVFPEPADALYMVNPDKCYGFWRVKLIDFRGCAYAVQMFMTFLIISIAFTAYRFIFVPNNEKNVFI